MMRYRTWVSLSFASFVFLALLGSSVLAQEDPSSAKEHANRAEVWIMVDGPPELPGFVAEVLPASGVEDIARDAGYALGLHPIPSMVEGRLVARIVVERERDDAQDNPRQVLKAVCRRLQQFLNVIADPRSPETKRQLTDARKRAEHARETVRSLRSELRQCRLRLARQAVAPNELENEICRLHRQKLGLEVEQAGLRARREMMLKRMAHKQRELPIRVQQQDSVLRELRERISELEQIARQAPRRGKEHPLEAELDTQLRALQAEFQKRSEVLQEMVHSHSLAERNEQLAGIEVEMAMIEAKFAAIGRMLDRLESKDVRHMVDRCELLEDELNLARERWAIAREEFRRVEHRQASFRPLKVNVLDYRTMMGRKSKEGDKEKSPDKPAEE